MYIIDSNEFMIDRVDSNKIKIEGRDIHIDKRINLSAVHPLLSRHFIDIIDKRRRTHGSPSLGARREFIASVKMLFKKRCKVKVDVDARHEMRGKMRGKWTIRIVRTGHYTLNNKVFDVLRGIPNVIT